MKNTMLSDKAWAPRPVIAGLLAAAAWVAQAGAMEGPRLELRRGETCFRDGGRPAFVLGRNPVGRTPAAYDEHFRHAAENGERFMRIHFTYIPPGEKAGEVDAGMLRSWDAVLDAAERRGLAVLPVLGIWSDWNDGSNKENWHLWDRNPFNAARGGPAQRPDELFDDTACRRLWMQRLEIFVRRWSPRRAIVGWEIFSELDLVTGADEDRAVRFTELAAATIRKLDPLKRPVTASQAGVNEWPKLLRSDALDFIQIHPYAGGPHGGRLDELILSTVRQRLATYGKPVLIGECGLSAAPPHGTLDVAGRAETGIRHAIWASVVSGAMNGRMLWWQDGYDQFEQADLCRHYHGVAASAAAFVRGVDVSGFAPISCEPSAGLKGTVIGHDTLRLGWFRDARCIPPDWPSEPRAGETVVMAAPGSAWRAEFVDPVTGGTVGACVVPVHGGRIRIALPEFRDSLALRLSRADGPGGAIPLAGPAGPYTVARWKQDWPGCEWEDGISEGRLSVVGRDGGMALRVDYAVGGIGPNRGGCGWRFPIGTHRSAELSYTVRFGAGFDWSKGGKLPGLGGGPENVAGGRRATGTNGFSSRLMWGDGGRGHAYAYHVRQPGTYGDSLLFPEAFRFPVGTPVRIRMRVDMNDPGRMNGGLRVWTAVGDVREERLVVSRADMEWRTADTFGVDSVYFETFHGGGDASWAPSRPSSAEFSDIRVATFAAP